MLIQKAMRAFFFVVFFSVGAGALGTSILCDDLLRYYRNKMFLKQAQESYKRLQVLNTNYDTILEQVKSDPNFFKRIAPATLGVEPTDANTVYPQATAEQLAAARKALTKSRDAKFAEPKVPDWLSRCSETRRRIILFIAGAALVLVSFICFGPAKQVSAEQK